MPRGDGTGPMGVRSMTGRGAGYCAGFAAPGYMSAGAGYGMGFGRCRGMRRVFHLTDMPGWARCGYPAYSGAPAVDEKEYLNDQAELLEKQLQLVKKRLEILNGDTE